MIKPELIRQFEAEHSIQFDDNNLLQRAFIHSSYVNEREDATLQDNETLEFVGDAILGLIISAWLYRKFPAYNEGELTKLRAALVRGTTLARYARRLHLGKMMLLGRGEEEGGGRSRVSLLSDVFEAVVGAIYLDQGLETAQRFVLDLVEQEVALILADESLTRNAKSRLQEWSQGYLSVAPRYKTLQSDGPDHAKVFVTQVSLMKHPVGVGQGRSKQEASQAAAAMALHRLRLNAPEHEEDTELLAAYPLPEIDESLLAAD